MTCNKDEIAIRKSAFIDAVAYWHLSSSAPQRADQTYYDNSTSVLKSFGHVAYSIRCAEERLKEEES